MMRKWFSYTIVLLVCFVFFTNPAYAADFTNAKIRLDSMKASSSPGNILVTATVNVVNTEDSLQIAVGDAWTISSIASNFTTATSNLPSGTTAWPGISTATQVSGQTVTFPSNDLTPGTTYGFYLTGGITVNPVTGNDANYLWSLSTRSGGSASSQASIAIPVIPNDQINISATITPPSSSFTTNIATPDDTILIPQETILEYTITYGSTYVYDSPLTLQAQWSKGTISGESTPTLNILEYVPNSASQGYGSTAPVIDTAQRTITWDISSFPAATSGATVTFQLKTTSSYTGSSIIDFTVSSQVTSPVLTTSSTIDHTYQYVTTITPTPTPSATSAPGATATPTSVTATPTPILESSPLRFVSFAITSLQNTSATISVLLNQPAGVTLKYGESADLLNTSVSSSVLQNRHNLTLFDLSPGKTYFFQIEAKNSSNDIYSDFLSFTTPFEPDLTSIEQISLFSSGSHLISFTPDRLPHVLSTIGSSLEITLKVENTSLIHSATLTSNDENATYLGSLHQSQQNIFGGKIIIPRLYQTIPVMLTLESSSVDQPSIKSIRQFPLFFIHSSNQLRVLDQSTSLPIERAQVFVYRQNPQTKTFDLIPAPALINMNPLYTDGQGNIELVLIEGNYQFEVQAQGYQGQTLDFQVNDRENQTFPIFRLRQQKYFLLSKIPYHIQTIQQRLAYFISLLITEAQSSATFQVIVAFSIIFFTPITFLSLLARSNFSLKNFTKNFSHDTMLLFRSKLPEKKFLIGKVIDKKNKHPIAHAYITILDYRTRVTLDRVETGFQGRFSVGIHQTEKVILQVAAKGFMEESFDTKLTDRTTAVTISMEDRETPIEQVVSSTHFFVSHFLPQIFEALLILTLILQIIFFFSFRHFYILPFLVLSLFNLGVWLQQQYSVFLHRTHLT